MSVQWTLSPSLRQTDRGRVGERDGRPVSSFKINFSEDPETEESSTAEIRQYIISNIDLKWVIFPIKMEIIHKIVYNCDTL